MIRMNEYNQETMALVCPYCGESIEALIDYSSEPQEYYEDCSVCCAPIRFVLTLNDLNGELNVRVTRDDD